MASELNCTYQGTPYEDACALCDGLQKCRVRPRPHIEFFLPMIPPTATHQEKQVHIVKGKPKFYEPEELKAARAKLEAHLARYRPEGPMNGAVRLIVKWCFPITGQHQNGEYKTTKPDTDNLQKLLKDVMTKLGFWKDDAQVASEISEKFWATRPGIFISVEELEGQ